MSHRLVELGGKKKNQRNPFDSGKGWMIKRGPGEGACFKVPVCDVDNDSLEQEASAEDPEIGSGKEKKSRLQNKSTILINNNKNP